MALILCHREIFFFGRILLSRDACIVLIGEMSNNIKFIFQKGFIFTEIEKKRLYL